MAVHRPKILIVDDRPENLVALERLLGDFNIEFIRALSGNEALTLTFSHEFALAIIDIQMPEMDGLEATRKIREMQGDKSLPVVVAMTAGVTESDKQKCFDAGMDLFVRKPVKVPELNAAFEEALVLLKQRKGSDGEL